MDYRIRITKRKKETLFTFIVLLIASLLVLVPALSKGTSDDSVSLFFYLASVMVLVITRNIWILLLYYMILALNMYLMYIPCKFVGVSITTFVYVISILALLLSLVKHRFFFKQKNDTFLKFYFYVIFVVVLYSMNAYIHGTGVGTMIWRLSPVYFSMCMVIALKDYKKLQDIFIVAIIIAISIVTVVAYIELLQGATFFYHLWTGNGERYRNGIMRVGSTLGDPNTLAMYIVPCVFLLLTNRVKDTVGTKRSLAIVFFMILMVVLTSSRTSLLALILGVGIWFYFNGKSKTRLITIAGIFIIIALLPYFVLKFYNADVASSGQRIMLVFKAIDIWSENKIFGIGLDKFVEGTYWMPMNEYAKQLVEFGILGFLSYLSYYLIFIQQFFRGVKTFNKKRRGDAACIFAAVIAFAINSLSMDSYFHYIMWILPPLCFIFWDRNYIIEELSCE